MKDVYIGFRETLLAEFLTFVVVLNKLSDTLRSGIRLVVNSIGLVTETFVS